VSSLRVIPDPDVPVPALAGPTIGLFAGALGAWAASTALYLSGSIGWWVTVPVNAICAFVLFTVSHDCAHNSVSTNAQATTWLGRISTFVFGPGIGFRSWRFIHMQHHLNTNEDDGRDPDHYAQAGPAWLLPLRWLTMDFAYFRFYLPKVSKRPAAERAELAVTWAALLALVAAAAATGHFVDLLVVYLIPARLAVAILAWSFDWLPHHGLHEHKGREGRFKATRNRVGAERIMSPLLLNQNYHLVHHLHPLIPFYRYVQVWRRSEEHYLANEPSLTDVRGRPLTPDEYRQLRAH
jgi:ring-1,2-phenylacetyl-CoA epoxidase subunit PaaE